MSACAHVRQYDPAYTESEEMLPCATCSEMGMYLITPLPEDLTVWNTGEALITQRFEVKTRTWTCESLHVYWTEGVSTSGYFWLAQDTELVAGV